MSDYHLPVNIGNPEEITLNQCADEVIEIVGNPEIKIEYHDLPKDDPKVRRPDITLARQLLGWEPTVSRNEGLRATFEYFKKALS
ncbi:MAG TPA: hypothetical protein PLQ53_02000 [Saprospiraceae bacterium]|nr:hypothetical protein [Saprospiraceae bacterium]